MVKKQNCVIWILCFIVPTKVDNIYKDILDVETRFDNSNYELDGPLTKEEIKR